jgi:hypothetical protein
VVTSPRGGNGEEIRFWGRDIRIAHNTISDTEVRTSGTQTACRPSPSTTSTQRARTSYRGEPLRAHRQCLIADGPNSEAGNGSGVGRSRNVVFVDESATWPCSGIVGPVTKAFAFQNGGTGALVRDNQLGPEIGYEVGLDDSSQEGYHGLEPGGAP